MRKSVVWVGIAVFAVTLGGCSGRQASPISATSPFDQTLKCDDIRKEIVTNNWNMLNKARESLRTSHDNASAVAKVLPFGLMMLLAVDFRDAAGEELESYSKRNNTLTKIAQRKHCRIVDAYTTEDAIAIEAEERRRLPSAGSNVKEVTNDLDDQEVDPTVKLPKPIITARARQSPAPKASGRNSELANLMELFLKGEISKSEYDKLRSNSPSK